MGRKRFEKIDRARMAEAVGARPDATLDELRRRFGVVCALSAVCAALKKLGLSQRKDAPRRGSGPTGRGAAAGGVGAGAGGPGPAPGDLHRRDLSQTNMTGTCGRAPVGERLVAKIPHGHWKTRTLIGALGVGGVRCSTVVDGAVSAPQGRRGWLARVPGRVQDHVI